jgi:hypothetical protein
MKIGRRDFIGGAVLVGPASAVRHVALLSSTKPIRAAPMSEPLPCRPSGGGLDMSSVVFGVQGWDCYDQIAIGGPTTSRTNYADNALPGHQVRIGVNQSWRATWR